MIEVSDLHIRQGAFRLEGIDFQVSASQYAVLMGRTGSGKTSILEAICGLRSVAAGSIRLDGRDVTRLKPRLRNLGYVPQDAALFPSMTVRDNLRFALEVRQTPENIIETRVNELVDWLGIGHLLERHPANLSGGEKQRVALGRALALAPPVLMLDEPLSALDDDTREQMLDLLDHVRQRSAVTVLHVTHHRQDAERLGDVVFRLEAGKIQVDTPNPPEVSPVWSHQPSTP